MMRTTTQSLVANPDPFVDGRAPVGQNHARAFGGGAPAIIEVQARVRFREERERSAISASGVPRTRAQQIVENVLRLPCFDGVEQQHLRVDVHRDDASRWSHHYGLAVAIAIVASLARNAVPSQHLLLGDLDLRGHVRDVPSDLVDALNEAIESFAIESPLTILLAPDSATWVRASSTVRVVPVRTLGAVVTALWPGAHLSSQ